MTLEKSAEYARVNPQEADDAFGGQNSLKDAFDLMNYEVSESIRFNSNKMMISIARILSRMDFLSVALAYSQQNYTPRDDQEKQTLEGVLTAAKSDLAAKDPGVIRFQLMDAIMRADEDEEIYAASINEVSQLVAPGGYTRGKEISEELAAEYQAEMEKAHQELEDFERAAKFANLTPVAQ